MLIVAGIMRVQFVFSAAMLAENYGSSAARSCSMCGIEVPNRCEASYVSSARRLGWPAGTGNASSEKRGSRCGCRLFA